MATKEESITEVPAIVCASPVSSPKAGGDISEFPVSEEDIDLVANATKPLLDTKGGLSLDIVLSPAIKKGPKSRISPQNSPNPTNETISLRLKEAEGRRQSLGDAKLKNLAERLAKVSIVQQKKEEVFQEKVEKTKVVIETKLSTADENKAKQLAEVKSKVSEHMSKIEKAQKELEASLEAARQAAESSLTEKMDKSEELKREQLEDMLKKIKEHQMHVENVRTNQEEKLKPYVEDLQSTIKAKEERARVLKEEIDSKMMGKLAEQSKRADSVRQNKSKLQEQELSQTNESA